MTLKEEKDAMSVKVEFNSINSVGKNKFGNVNEVLKLSWEGKPFEKNKDISFRRYHDITFKIRDMENVERALPYIVLCLNTHIIFLYGKSQAGELLKDWAQKLIYGEDKILSLYYLQKSSEYRVKPLIKNKLNNR